MPEMSEAACGVAIDFETAHYDAASACAVGMARIQGDSVTDTYYTLIRPPRPQVLFTNIHGLTWPMLRDQPIFAEVWPDMAAFMQGAAFLVAHNASFDRRVLHACCKAAGLEAPRLPFCCTLLGSRRHLPLASRKLNDVCEYFGIPLEHHHAGSDALAAAHIFLKLRAQGIPARELRLK